MDIRTSNMAIKRGFTCGAFDLLHAGHCLMLEEAKKQCDYLIVGLQIDPSIERDYKHKPIQTVEERYIQLKSCKYVDEIWSYKTEADLVKMLKTIKPDIRIIGEDWRGRQFTGHELPIEVYYNSRSHNYSSSELRNRIKNG